jgi:hypothetical protein
MSFTNRLKADWLLLKHWIKKNLPIWLKDGIDAGIQWFVPFLLKLGMSSMVSEDRLARVKDGKLPRDPVAIPPEHEHEDDC